MDLKSFLQRVKTIIIEPDVEWEIIKNENNSRKNIFYKYVLPLIILGAISQFISNLFLGFTLFSNLVSSILYMLAMLGSLFFSSIIINELSVNFGMNKSRNISFTLVAYASTAFYLAQAAINLHNQLALLGLFSLYSIYLFWSASFHFITMNSKRRMGFSVICSLIIFFTFIIMQYVLSPFLTLTHKFNL